MDRKHQQLIRLLHDRIGTGMRFSETDTISLLILVRQAAGKHVRELADFIAHRERHKGLTPTPDRSNANILIETKEIEASRIGYCPLSMDQAVIDAEISNIRVVTEMGAELLALVQGLAKLKLLFSSVVVEKTQPPSPAGEALF